MRKKLFNTQNDPVYQLDYEFLTWLKCYLDIKPNSSQYFARKFDLKRDNVDKWSQLPVNINDIVLDVKISPGKMARMIHFMRNDIMN